MFSDLRFAFRQLIKSPGFTAIIVLTLALAIGACTAIYSALDSIVLRPFDDPDTARNVVLRSIRMPQGVEGSVSDPDFRDIAPQAKSFDFMARGFDSVVNVTGAGEPTRLRRMNATERWFDVFGVRMALGRAFRPEEFLPGGTGVAILSYSAWQRLFGGAPDVIGKSIVVDDRPRIVVGVTSESFERSAQNIEIWHPYPPERGTGEGRDVRAVRDRGVVTARLRRDVSFEQAQREMDVLAAALAKQYPDTNRDFSIKMVRGIEAGSRTLGVMIVTLFAAVGCLLLIACANVATLLLVRANARQREMSVRAALGGTRWQLLRQLFTESFLLALLGGVGGLLLAQWAVDFMRSSLPAGNAFQALSRLTYLKLDSGVLLFAVGLSVLTAVVFGLAPAWLASSADVNEALKQSSRGNSEGRSRGRLRSTLIVVEIAIAVTLLACTGLLIRSFAKATAHQPGFDPADVTVVSMQLSRGKYRGVEPQVRVISAMLTRIQNQPGVELAAASQIVPLGTWAGRVGALEVQGAAQSASGERPAVNFTTVSPDFFQVLRIPLKRGRFFTARDDLTAPRVAIINETLARQQFGDSDPIGQRIRLGSETDPWREVVGVVGNVTLVNVGETPRAQVYDPMAQRPEDGFNFLIRSKLPAGAVIAMVKKQVQTVDADLPLGAASALVTRIHHKYTAQRLTLQLLTAFAVIALLVAALGIYSVIAFSVGQRTLEIGIRMALGASAHDVVRLVLRQGAVMVGAGIAVGVITTLLSGRALESQLYQTRSYDPLTLTAITGIFVGVAALACWLPARRATKVDPIVALRAE